MPSKQAFLKMKGIRNIIFDLGGVILPIDPEKTIGALTALVKAPRDPKEIKNQIYPLIQALESGKLDGDTFLEDIAAILGGNPGKMEIMDAWCMMLGELPIAHLALLHDLRQHYRIFLLSNTNALHFERYAPYFRDGHREKGLHDIFDGLVLSCQEGLMKPDERIYQILMQRYLLENDETLFIDDNEHNIRAAKAIGIHAYWLYGGQSLVALFDSNARLREGLDY